MRWDAVIFDCDGTLVDSERLANEVLVDCAKGFGIDLTVEEALSRFRGLQMAECVSHLEALRGSPLPATFVPKLRARTQDVFAKGLRPVAGAAELLASLSVRCCIASGAPRQKIEFSLAVTGLQTHFRGPIFSSYDVKLWKPNPGLFLHAAQSMGVVAGRCVVVEDSIPGVRAGLAAGMTVFVLSQENVAYPNENGVQVVAHLKELYGVFRAAGIAV